MSIKSMYFALFCLVLCTFFCSCASDEIEFNPSISTCGGFDDEIAYKVKTSALPLEDCDEAINWIYNEDTNILRITNDYINLNCCGDHTVKVSLNKDGTYVVSEKDEPLNGSRCSCNCYFDYRVDIPDVIDGIVRVKITREVTDADEYGDFYGTGVNQIWSGELDLSEKNGTILIKENEYCELS